MWNKVAVNQVGNLALAENTSPSDIYETFFEPDVMLPSQFHDSDEEGLLGGERKLMAAILSDGIESYLNDKSEAVQEIVRSKVSINGALSNGVIALKGMRSEAIDWVETIDESYVFSFDNVCRCLGIEPQYLRLGLARYVAGVYTKSTTPGASSVVAWKKIRRPRKR